MVIFLLIKTFHSILTGNLNYSSVSVINHLSLYPISLAPPPWVAQMLWPITGTILVGQGRVRAPHGGGEDPLGLLTKAYLLTN